MKHTATEHLLANVRYFRCMAAEYLKASRRTQYKELELFLYKKTIHYIEGLVAAIAIYEGIAPKEVIKLAKNQRP